MGVIYYGLCHDCKNYIDLDKFYSFAVIDDASNADLCKENLDEYGDNKGFIFRSLRLQSFIKAHRDHRIGVHTEHTVEEFWYDRDDAKDEWKEQMKWPMKAWGEGSQDGIDFTDPKAERLEVRTRLGTIYIDVRYDGVNCWTMDGGPRRDWLILPVNPSAQTAPPSDQPPEL